MNWMDEVSARLKRHNQVLFAKDSEFLQDLDLLFREQSHITLTLWAFDLAEESVAALEEKHPRERRPREALVAAQDWAAGRIKMPLAQRKILDLSRRRPGLRRGPHRRPRPGIPHLRPHPSHI